MQRKFLICKTCGNLIEMIIDSGVTPKCCNNEMVELIANTTEAATEKHIPVIEINEDITLCYYWRNTSSNDRRTFHPLDLFRNK